MSQNSQEEENIEDNISIDDDISMPDMVDEGSSFMLFDAKIQEHHYRTKEEEEVEPNYTTEELIVVSPIKDEKENKLNKQDQLLMDGSVEGEEEDNLGIDEDLELLCDQALAEKFKEERKVELNLMKKEIDSKITYLQNIK